MTRILLDEGDVRAATLSLTPPPFIGRRARPRSARKREGLRYEAKAQKEFQRRYGNAYVPSPWFKYLRGSCDMRPYWCQPDGMIVLPQESRIILIEMKLHHTPDAWDQLFRLYRPVVLSWLREAPGPWEVECVEVVRWFDPAVETPTASVLREEPLDAYGGNFCVHIWHPRLGSKGRAERPPPLETPKSHKSLARFL